MVVVVEILKEEELDRDLACPVSESLCPFLDPLPSLPCLTSDHPQGILQGKHQVFPGAGECVLKVGLGGLSEVFSWHQPASCALVHLLGQWPQWEGVGRETCPEWGRDRLRRGVTGKRKMCWWAFNSEGAEGFGGGQVDS